MSPTPIAFRGKWHKGLLVRQSMKPNPYRLSWISWWLSLAAERLWHQTPIVYRCPARNWPQIMGIVQQKKNLSFTAVLSYEACPFKVAGGLYKEIVLLSIRSCADPDIYIYIYICIYIYIYIYNPKGVALCRWPHCKLICVLFAKQCLHLRGSYFLC